MNPLKNGLTINIEINGVPIQANPVKQATSIKKTTKPDKDEDTADSLGVQLINRDSLDDAELVKLEMNVTKFIRSLLQKHKIKLVKNFILEHKHHLTPELKDALSDEIKLAKIGKSNG